MYFAHLMRRPIEAFLFWVSRYHTWTLLPCQSLKIGGAGGGVHIIVPFKAAQSTWMENQTTCVHLPASRRLQLQIRSAH